MSASARDIPDEDAAENGAIALARRNALILAAAQAIVGAAAPISISIGGLAGDYLLGADKTLATAPVTGFTAGMALGAIGAAAFMRLVGRRIGFVSGGVVTAGGGALAALSLAAGSFWSFTMSLILIGMGGAFVQQYRFAAADGAPVRFKPQAISWVLAGGIFAAVIGPQTVILTREAFVTAPFAGVFVATIGLGLLGAAILSFLRVPDMTPRAGAAAAELPARPLSQIVVQPRFLAAFVCAVGSYTLMTFMMTGAPLAMVACGFSPDIATLGIQWHVMAMFAPSFVTGTLIRRFGAEIVVATGLVILIVCTVVAFVDIQLWNFWIALILLGIGWNFGFIGSTAMVTTTYRESERSKVQGFHDGILFTLVALASLGSGVIFNIGGWSWIATVVGPAAGLCLLMLLALWSQGTGAPGSQTA